MSAGYRRCARVWVALLALLLATWGSAYLPLGMWNAIINMAIAAIKVALVAAYFMHLAGSRGALRLAAAVAPYMLALLFVLAGADYAYRQWHWAPWQVPQQLRPIVPRAG